jgi:hypothetical protein
VVTRQCEPVSFTASILETQLASRTGTTDEVTGHRR